MPTLIYDAGFFCNFYVGLSMWLYMVICSQPKLFSHGCRTYQGETRLGNLYQKLVRNRAAFYTVQVSGSSFPSVCHPVKYGSHGKWTNQTAQFWSHARVKVSATSFLPCVTSIRLTVNSLQRCSVIVQQHGFILYRFPFGRLLANRQILSTWSCV